MDYELLKFVWWLLIGGLLIGFALLEGLDLGARVLTPFLAAQSAVLSQQTRPFSWPQHITLFWLLALCSAIVVIWPSLGLLPCVGGGLMGVLLLLRQSIGSSVRPVGAWSALVIGLIPAALIGVVLGNLLLGLPFSRCALTASEFHGTLSGLFRPYALLLGAISLSMFCQLGATWVMLRGSNALRQVARRIAWRAGVVFLVGFTAAALWLAADIRGYRLAASVHSHTLCSPGQRVVLPGNAGWHGNFSAWPLACLAPLLALSGTALSLYSIMRGRAAMAVVGSGLTIVMMLCSIGVALFPFIIPSSVQLSASLTVWNAASGEKTLGLMLILASVLMPMLLAYTVGAGLRDRNRPIQSSPKSKHSQRIQERQQRLASPAIHGDHRIA